MLKTQRFKLLAAMVLAFFTLSGCGASDRIVDDENNQSENGNVSETTSTDENSEQSNSNQAAACLETPEGEVIFPDDEGVHSEELEWWYWTGHLQAEDGRWFGFEQVFF